MFNFSWKSLALFSDILKDIKNIGVVVPTIFPFNSPSQFCYKPNVSQRMIVEIKLTKDYLSRSCFGCYDISTKVYQYGLWNMECAYRTGKYCPLPIPIRKNDQKQFGFIWVDSCMHC